MRTFVNIHDRAFNIFSSQVKDLSNAVQAAIQFVMNDKAEEKRIFSTTICSTCGGKKSKQDIVIELHPKQMAFLRSIPQAYAVKDEHVSSARIDTLPAPI